MSTQEARARADAKYKRDKTTQVPLRFYNATESDLIEHLNAQDNKAGYIKSLIRADMERKKAPDLE